MPPPFSFGQTTRNRKEHPPPSRHRVHPLRLRVQGKTPAAERRSR